MWLIKYCGSWNYKPQAESLSAEMNGIGLSTTIEEGDTGQFELFESQQGEWITFLKGGHGKFFSLENITNKLGEIQWLIIL